LRKAGPGQLSKKRHRSDAVRDRQRPHRSQRVRRDRGPDGAPSAVVRLACDAPVCPAEFAAAIKAGMDAFGGFRYGLIGLTPKPSPDVREVDPNFDEGVNAYTAKNYKLALARLTPFPESGDARAQSYLGSMYEYGRGVERDYREALRWLVMAAEQGDTYSQAHAGYLYEQGLGVARDHKLA